MNNKLVDNNVKVPKKRGRRPKGGKIVEIKNILVNNIPIPNIILHLNCKINDIENNNNFIKYEPKINSIDNFEFESNNLKFNYINSDNINDKHNSFYDTIIDTENNNNLDNTNNTNNTNNTKNIENIEKLEYIENNITQDNIKNIAYKKNISRKLKELNNNLKHNNISNKSACFWCTCSFDNDPIYIPKYQLSNITYCYGCFCSPECACSYLLNENIDSSTKFERYYLLNNVYGKIYDYKKNIKPAPSPFYLLNKFYGNLDIQEYRKLLENERLLLVVNKPLSQVFPEIYEENEDFLISAKLVSKSSTGSVSKNIPLKK